MQRCTNLLRYFIDILIKDPVLSGYVSHLNLNSSITNASLASTTRFAQVIHMRGKCIGLV